MKLEASDWIPTGHPTIFFRGMERTLFLLGRVDDEVVDEVPRAEHLSVTKAELVMKAEWTTK